MPSASKIDPLKIYHELMREMNADSCGDGIEGGYNPDCKGCRKCVDYKALLKIDMQLHLMGSVR